MISTDAPPAIGGGADFGCVLGRRRTAPPGVAAPAVAHTGLGEDGPAFCGLLAELADGNDRDPLYREKLSGQNRTLRNRAAAEPLTIECDGMDDEIRHEAPSA